MGKRIKTFDQNLIKKEVKNTGKIKKIKKKENKPLIYQEDEKFVEEKVEKKNILMNRIKNEEKVKKEEIIANDDEIIFQEKKDKKQISIELNNLGEDKTLRKRSKIDISDDELFDNDDNLF